MSEKKSGKELLQDFWYALIPWIGEGIRALILLVIVVPLVFAVWQAWVRPAESWLFQVFEAVPIAIAVPAMALWFHWEYCEALAVVKDRDPKNLGGFMRGYHLFYVRLWKAVLLGLMIFVIVLAVEDMFF